MRWIRNSKVWSETIEDGKFESAFIFPKFLVEKCASGRIYSSIEVENDEIRFFKIHIEGDVCVALLVYSPENITIGVFWSN